LKIKIKKVLHKPKRKKQDKKSITNAIWNNTDKNLACGLTGRGWGRIRF